MTAAEWLAEIEARAAAATKGPWDYYDHESTGPSVAVLDDMWVISLTSRPSVDTWEDAAFIAHARVDVPWLVEQVRIRDAAIEAALALHERVTRWGNEDYSISQDTYDDAEPEDLTSLVPFDVCAECFRIEQTSEQHDGAECEHAVLDGLWPCPTSRALDSLS